jgi:hypothetical protein
MPANSAHWLQDHGLCLYQPFDEMYGYEATPTPCLFPLETSTDHDTPPTILPVFASLAPS